ncbi:MAG: MBL fold metallo-hydrolase [Gemmatimonadota bacterium]
MNRHKILLLATLGTIGCSPAADVVSDTDPDPAPTIPTEVVDGARVVMLGTGNPNADPERSGPAVAVVVEDQAYIFDAGPGVVRRAAQAARDLDIPALAADRLNRVFITHLHSDHTTGLPDLLLGPWVLDRPDPLQVVGPPGVESMMNFIVDAWSADIDKRIFGLEPRDANRDAYRPVVLETEGGLVYTDDHVEVFAIPVIHGDWDHSFGYRVVTEDRTIVISGDAAPSETLVEACNGCDVLVHEVYSGERFVTRPSVWQAYHSVFHTSPEELADIAARAGAQKLVLYHQLYWGTDDDGLLAEMRAAGWTGPLESARDLGVY